MRRYSVPGTEYENCGRRQPASLINVLDHQFFKTNKKIGVVQHTEVNKLLVSMVGNIEHMRSVRSINNANLNNRAVMCTQTCRQ